MFWYLKEKAEQDQHTQTNPRQPRGPRKKGLAEVATEGKGKINILDSPSVCVFSFLAGGGVHQTHVRSLRVRSSSLALL